MSRFKKLYDFLLENGELLELFPEMSGQWKTDKEEFTRQQKETENLSKNIQVNDFD